MRTPFIQIWLLSLTLGASVANAQVPEVQPELVCQALGPDARSHPDGLGSLVASSSSYEEIRIPVLTSVRQLYESFGTDMSPSRVAIFHPADQAPQYFAANVYFRVTLSYSWMSGHDGISARRTSAPLLTADIEKLEYTAQPGEVVTSDTFWSNRSSASARQKLVGLIDQFSLSASGMGITLSCKTVWPEAEEE